MLLVVCLIDPLEGVHEPDIVSHIWYGTNGDEGAYMWSKVGVMYRIKLIRKKGTCKTELARKSIPPTSLSSHETVSKLMKKEAAHSVALTAMIWGRTISGCDHL